MFYKSIDPQDWKWPFNTDGVRSTDFGTGKYKVHDDVAAIYREEIC